MKSLLQFILKYNAAFIFVVFQIICLILIFGYNDYHRSTMLNSGNRVSGKVNKQWQEVVDYMHLKEENSFLREENALLINELEQRRAFQHNFNYFNVYSPFTYTPAKVVNISINKIKNYITLDVGKNHGIKNEMAVMGPTGVAGIIFRTSAKYSVAIPIVNTDFMLSVKIAGSQYFGSLRWKGPDHRFAEISDIPGHVNIEIGDSVYTSGYSAIFPNDLPVGVISDFSIDNSSSFYEINVELCTDFGKLQNVYIINNSDKTEINTIQEIND